MGVMTLKYLAEGAFSLIEGGDPAAASSISYNELKAYCAAIITIIVMSWVHYSIIW